jgi:TetR/AcrR family transcriptional regulator, regulator of autoinduction and epiphytic fitness
VAVIPDPVRADGRRLRREQNRAAAIDAVLALFREGIYQPATEEIAARAGLSTRSLFRYFDDLSDLHLAAADRQLQLALPLVVLAARPDEPTAAKIRALVSARVRLFEEVAPSARALRAAAHRRDHLRGVLGRNRSYLRRQISQLFAPELAQAAPGVAAALQVLCSFESYDLLRHDQGLSPADAAAALTAGLGALLGAAAAEPGPGQAA